MFGPSRHKELLILTSLDVTYSMNCVSLVQDRNHQIDTVTRPELMK
jgi:hypothetical protein